MTPGEVNEAIDKINKIRKGELVLEDPFRLDARPSPPRAAEFKEVDLKE
jgi:hypothetical protein